MRAQTRRILYLSQALEDLKAEVLLVVTDIGGLAALIGAQVAGTADVELTALTVQLKAATDAVAAILAPAPVVAPVDPAPVA